MNTPAHCHATVDGAGSLALETVIPADPLGTRNELGFNGMVIRQFEAQIKGRNLL